jgi:rhamnosyltransferase
MHDWWLALCAAAMGEVLHLPEATVLYRQHGRNALGSRGWRVVRRETLRRPLVWWRRSSTLFARAVHQGCELARRVERQSRETGVSHPSLATLQEFRAAFLGVGGPLGRLRVVRRHGIRPESLLPYPVFFYARVLLGTTPSVGGGPDVGNPTSSSTRAAPWRRHELPTFSSKD